jgi:hypothetical protein
MYHFFISWPSKIYPNFDFWFENIPSGNPAPMTLKVVLLSLATKRSDLERCFSFVKMVAKQKVILSIGA